jgi:hypothetical protein
VAFGPGDPYRQPQGYRLDDVKLRLWMLLSEGSTLVLDQMDDALDTLLQLLRTQPTCAVDRVAAVGSVREIGGVGYIGAIVDVTLGIERTAAPRRALEPEGAAV